MKVLLCILLFTPCLVKGQTDSYVVYKEIYRVKGLNKGLIPDYARAYINENRNNFFLASSYSVFKIRIETGIDTSDYGHYVTKGDSVITQCLFIYIANSTDVIRGDVIFTGSSDKALILLRNVHYTKYEMQKGKLLVTKEGNYKDLDICKHCNVSGIKVAEMMNMGFVHLSLAYHEYLKRKLKEKNAHNP